MGWCCVDTGEDMSSSFVVCLLVLATTSVTDSTAPASATADDVKRKLVYLSRYILPNPDSHHSRQGKLMCLWSSVSRCLLLPPCHNWDATSVWRKGDINRTSGFCPIPGGLSLRPVKNRGDYLSVWVLSLLYWFCTLCSNVSFTSLFPLYPVQYKFIAIQIYSGGDNIKSHSPFWLNILLMAGEVGEPTPQIQLWFRGSAVSSPGCRDRAVTAMDIHSYKNQTSMPLAVIGVASLLPVMQSVFSK